MYNEQKTEIYKIFSDKTPIFQYDEFKERIDLAKKKSDIIWP